MTQRLTLAVVLGLSLAVASSRPVAAAWQAPPARVASQPVIHQLRVYEIFEGNKKAFHDRFRDHAMRIMKRHDFNIVATWESRRGDRTEFVYLLEWPDDATLKDRWSRFMKDEEWIRIKKETNVEGAPLVGEIQDRTLELTGYSPRRALTR
jgi:hypothetical protein